MAKVPWAEIALPVISGVSQKVKDVRFSKRAAPYLGDRQERQWRVAEWILDQDIASSNRMNDLWVRMDSLFRANPWGNENGNRKLQMAFMACFNVDRFRQFVFESSFLTRAHPQILFRRMGMGVSFQFINEQFSARSRKTRSCAETYRGTSHKQPRSLTPRLPKGAVYGWKPTRFDVSKERIEKIASDDVEMMMFGFDWVRLFLTGRASFS